MLTAIDHIALVVHALDEAVAGYETLLGCPPNWRGGDDGVAHAWFQLGNTALDVIGVAGPGRAGDQIKARLDAHGEGLWAIAFAVNDIAAVRRRLERRSVGATETMPVRSTRADGAAARVWPTSILNPKAARGATLFLVEATEENANWPAVAKVAPANAAVAGLDHVVVQTSDPERAAAFYGARLGLEMALDRTNPDWGTRLMFFRCGDAIVEVAHALNAPAQERDVVWGLSWRVPDADAARAHLQASGMDVSEVREGRKPGTRVFTVRNAPAGVPTLMLQPAQRSAP
ncbi:MAG: glyoxalase [Alphaproteobacteria bacterium]|nr:glyoxalase [Alphaproteobacteria bacterium]